MIFKLTTTILIGQSTTNYVSDIDKSAPAYQTIILEFKSYSCLIMTVILK